MSFIPALFTGLGATAAASPLTTALTVGAGLVQTVGALSSASAAASADRYNEQVDRRNQQVALEQGVAQADEQRRKNELALGRLRASYGAAGIAMAGDALGVYQDSATQAAYDLAKTHWDAKMRSIGYGDQAELDSSKANADSTAGLFGALNAGANTGVALLKAA